jgi:DNA repair protein RecN (Recombination protein N)
VLCVTHQPQVASQGHQHLKVSKHVKNKQTSTQVETLIDARRTQEIARMLGGIELTERTLDHASEMLAMAE